MEKARRVTRAARRMAGAAARGAAWIYLHAIYNPLVFRRRVRAARAYARRGGWRSAAADPERLADAPLSIQLMHMEVRDAAELTRPGAELRV